MQEECFSPSEHSVTHHYKSFQEIRISAIKTVCCWVKFYCSAYVIRIVLFSWYFQSGLNSSRKPVISKKLSSARVLHCKLRGGIITLWCLSPCHIIYMEKWHSVLTNCVNRQVKKLIGNIATNALPALLRGRKSWKAATAISTWSRDASRDGHAVLGRLSLAENSISF